MDLKTMDAWSVLVNSKGDVFVRDPNGIFYPVNKKKVLMKHR